MCGAEINKKNSSSTLLFIYMRIAHCIENLIHTYTKQQQKQQRQQQAIMKLKTQIQDVYMPKEFGLKNTITFERNEVRRGSETK